MERRDFVRASAGAVGGLVLARRGLSAGSPAAFGVRPGPSVDPAARDLVLAALDAARAAGAHYADARVGLYRQQRISTREARVKEVSEGSSLGLGVRALVDGSWGFAATRELTREAASQAGRSAAATGRASASVQPAPITLAPVERYGEVSWRGAFEIDPWDVPVADKVDHLVALNEVALRNPAVSFVTGDLHFVKIEQTSGTTEGTIASQTIVRTNPGLTITAVSPDRTDFQTRASSVSPAGRGWEHVLDHLTPDAVERWAAEAAEKLSAASVEPGRYDLILLPSHLWLTIHESIGHPTELDRALGYEANYAGTSFLAPPAAVLGTLQFGSDLVNIQAERTSEGGLASIGWDEEGVRATEWPIIRDGMFVDYQTTREQAGWISDLTGNERSHGCAHSDSWASIPFQRMPNMNLLPGREGHTVEDLIAGTESGILIDGDGSYSIDHQRFNFQFGGQAFWEIRAGRRTRMLRDVAYQARTTDFWGALDMLGGASTYETSGSFYDGKGQPGQSNAVSHGCPVARFRNVAVLNTAR